MLGRDEKGGGVLVLKRFKFCGKYKIQLLRKIPSLVCSSLLGVHNVHAMYMNVLAKITKNKEFYFNFWHTNRTYDDEYCKQHNEVVELAGSITIPILKPSPP